MKDRLALITGASRGIGREIAMSLCRTGHRAVFTYETNADAAESAIEELHREGFSALALQMTVEDRHSVVSVLDELRGKCGSVEILVNNAAISQAKTFDTINDQDWDRMMAVNLRGPFICAQECLPHMIANGWGRIINITSIGGQWGGFNQVHYAASKAALINFTHSLAKLYSGSGVTTNAVAIGLVPTDMSAKELATEAGRAKIEAIPSGRLGTVQDIANAVVFLSSEKSEYITGQTINLNGGMYFG